MIKDTKFLATDVAPNPKEITHWIDLNEDPTGGVIKTFDGKEWGTIESKVSDEDFTELKNTVSELQDGLQTSIQQLQTTIQSLNTQLTSLNSQIGTLNDEITSLKERVTALENPEPPIE